MLYAKYVGGIGGLVTIDPALFAPDGRKPFTVPIGENDLHKLQVND